MSALEQNLVHRVNVGDVLHRSASRHPDRLAVRFGDREVTYRELDELANRFAHVMAAVGVGRGDVVAFFAPNSLEYVAAFFGCPRIGAALAPINVMYTPDDIEHVVETTRAKALVVASALRSRFEQAAQAMASIERRFVLGEKAPSYLSLEDALGEAATSFPEYLVENDDAATIIFTSGTTAKPKAVVNTNLNWGLTLVAAVADLEITRKKRLLVALPMFHSGGLYLTYAAIATGGSMQLLRAVDGAEILKAIADRRVNMVALPATAWVGLLRAPNVDALDFSGLQTALVFQYLPTAVFERWRKLAPRAEWINYWGQTEMIPLGSSTHPEDFERKLARPNPIGLAHLPLEVRVVDDEMREVPVGVAGELVARGPTITPGYLGDPEANEELFRGGWHHTGDVGYRDEEGYFYFVDRKKDIIKSGGENVSSQEVEEALAKLVGVSEVAVVGIPDPYWIEAVAAVVVPHAGARLTEEAILTFAREHLAAFKVPKRVFLRDDLPKNPTGKVLKRVLREQLEKLGAVG